MRLGNINGNKMLIDIHLLIVIIVWSVSVEAIGSGNYISITEAPYYVALDDLQYKFVQETNYCGGAILSEYWVITAAHCAENVKRKPMRARTGGTTQLSDGIFHDVEKIIIHPDYETSFVSELESPISHNDIALLKLATPISFSNYQQPIQLSNKQPQVNDTVSIVGLGLEGETVDTVSLKRNEMKVDVIDDFNPKWIPTTFVVTDEHSSACGGDSGGPVVSDNKLVGILVMGFNCRSWSNRFQTQINFVTSIHKYYDWIVHHAGLSY